MTFDTANTTDRRPTTANTDKTDRATTEIR